MLHKHSLKASRNCLQSNPLTRTALGPVITSIHLVRVSTYPYLYFTQCVQMGPNKLYTFTWVIHLSGIHLERFGCTYIHRYGKSQNLNLNKIIRHETKAKPNWQPRQTMVVITHCIKSTHIVDCPKTAMSNLSKIREQFFWVLS